MVLRGLVLHSKVPQVCVYEKRNNKIEHVVELKKNGGARMKPLYNDEQLGRKHDSRYTLVIWALVIHDIHGLMSFY